MKKIGLFIRSLKKGGSENQSILLAKALSEKYEVRLIVFVNGGSLKERAFQELNMGNIFFVEGKNYLTKFYHFIQFLKKEKLDVLFCYLPSNNIIGTIGGRIAGIPLIFGGLRGSRIKDNKLKMLSQKFILNHFATAIISNSHKAKKAYSAYGIKDEKIQVIHNAINLNRDLFLRKDKGLINILSVGRFVEEKDYKTALLSIFESLKVNNNIIYTLVGYGEKENEIRKFIKELGIADSVIIKIDPPDIDDYYKKADIFLLTSVHEGMPNAVMEAMSFSLPVVSTNAGDVSYLVRDGVNGYICRKGNYSEISSKLLKLVHSYALRLKFGTQSLEIIMSEFSLSKLSNNYELFIQQYLR